MSFCFYIINQLIKNIRAAKLGGEPSGVSPRDSDIGRRKFLFVVKVTANLDPNLKFFLNSLKTALLMRTISMRLIIMEGQKIIAGQET